MSGKEKLERSVNALTGMWRRTRGIVPRREPMEENEEVEEGLVMSGAKWRTMAVFLVRDTSASAVARVRAAGCGMHVERTRRALPLLPLLPLPDLTGRTDGFGWRMWPNVATTWARSSEDAPTFRWGRVMFSAKLRAGFTMSMALPIGLTCRYHCRNLSLQDMPLFSRWKVKKRPSLDLEGFSPERM